MPDHLLTFTGGTIANIQKLRCDVVKLPHFIQGCCFWQHGALTAVCGPSWSDTSMVNTQVLFPATKLSAWHITTHCRLNEMHYVNNIYIIHIYDIFYVVIVVQLL